MNVTLSLFAGVAAQFLDNNGLPLSGGKIYTYIAGTTTPLATYTTNLGTVAQSNPIILNASGRIPVGELWLTTGFGYKFIVEDANNVLIGTYDNVPSSSQPPIINDASSISYEPGPVTIAGSFIVGDTYLINSLGNTNFQLIGASANQIGTLFIATGVGSGTGTAELSRTVQAKLRESVSTKDFGCVGDGITNDTISMLSFFNYCIDNNISGHILSGNYLINEGELNFNCNFISANFPEITTDGHFSTIFTMANYADAPMFTFSNGTATSPTGNYWQGGCLGGITINAGATPLTANRHGISMYGMSQTQFGIITCNGLGGSAVYMPAMLYEGYNPDPYANNDVTFEGIEANNCQRYALENLFGVGFTGCRVSKMLVNNTLLGGIFGLGSGNSFGPLSMQGVQGYAIHDGGLGSNRISVIETAELQNCKYGIYLNKINSAQFNNIRFVHSYQTSPNTTTTYWPLTCINLGPDAYANVSNLYINCVHRIDPGGTLAALSPFVNGNNNGNLNTVEIDQTYTDEGGIGITDSYLFINMSAGSVSRLTNATKQIFYTKDINVSFARGDTSTTIIPTTGFGSSVIAFNYQFYGTYSTAKLYNTTTSNFTALRTGLYQVTVNIPLALPIGTKLELGVADGTYILLASYFYSTTANATMYTLSGYVNLNIGEKLYVTASQDTASPINASAFISNNDIQFVVAEIGF